MLLRSTSFLRELCMMEHFIPFSQERVILKVFSLTKRRFQMQSNKIHLSSLIHGQVQSHIIGHILLLVNLNYSHLTLQIYTAAVSTSLAHLARVSL